VPAWSGGGDFSMIEEEIDEQQIKVETKKEIAIRLKKLVRRLEFDQLKESQQSHSKIKNIFY
jgi:hypothetical protein